MSGFPPKKSKPSKIRSIHSKFGQQGILAGLDRSKKSRPKKESGSSKYEMLKKSAIPDYTDVAYREAVSRLRYLLNESYVSPGAKYPVGSFKHEESDEESATSPITSERARPSRMSPFRRPLLPRKKSLPNFQSPYGEDVENVNQYSESPELLAFIERQEEYIDQLEKEAQYCRDELSVLLGRVKELISENESLQDQQKTGLMKVMFEGMDSEKLNEFQSPKHYRQRLEGPLIVFESRISELEAQLTQSKIDLRKAQEETEMYKKKLEDCQPSLSNYDFYSQIENLQREKRDLSESLAKLQASISQIREKEIDAAKKAQRTLDVVDKTQFEKQQAEMEVYRLKSELEIQHDKLLEVLSEQTRKVADERNQAERRYQQHIERLNGDLTVQRDALTKLQMEVEKHQRIEEDLKRDLLAKNLTIESVKKELNLKIGSLQKELASALSERDALEQEINTNRMSSERSDRINKQEANRLQVEISALKKRLDGGDAELIHSRRENLRLLEKISALEKELTLYKIKLGEQRDPIEDEEQKAREKIINSRISEIEAKHVKKVSDLEGLIENQSQVMAQLKAECESLTQKLEESTARHKQELENLQSNLTTLNTKMDTNFGPKHSLTDDISKDPETTVGQREKYETLAKEPISVDALKNYNQRFLEEESQKSAASAFDPKYSSGPQHQQSFQVLETSTSDKNYGNPYVEKFESSSGNGVKQNLYFNGQGGDYLNYHSNGQKSSNYQEKMSTYQDKPLPSSEQPYSDGSSFYSSYQERPSYQEPQTSCQDQQQYQEQPAYQRDFTLPEQVTYNDRITSEESITLNSSVTTMPSPAPILAPTPVIAPVAASTPAVPTPTAAPTLAPATIPVPVPAPVTTPAPAAAPPPPVEPMPNVQPEMKPPPPPVETPTTKTAPSQRFQRAAELSRQNSKSDDLPKTRLTSQQRLRNAQLARNQTKTQSSRFK